MVVMQDGLLAPASVIGRNADIAEIASEINDNVLYRHQETMGTPLGSVQS